MVPESSKLEMLEAMIVMTMFAPAILLLILLLSVSCQCLNERRLMSELEDLQALRKTAWKQVRCSHELMVRARKLYESLHARYLRDEESYEAIDHRLAMIDGRHKLCQPAETGKGPRGRRPAVIDLTEDQILMLAQQLGIVLPTYEGSEEDEQSEE